MRPSPMSPIGITSISVSAMPLPCAHCISDGISSSFRFFSATALILTARPAARAASMPPRTLSRSPQRVIALNFAGSSVSSETLMRRTPQSAQFAGEARQLRAVGGERQFIERAGVEVARQRAHQRHHVAPDQRLAAGQPQFPHALGDEGRAQPVEFLQRQADRPWAGTSCLPTCNRSSAGRSDR